MKSLSFTLVVMVGAFACGYCLQQGLRVVQRTAVPTVTPPAAPGILPELPSDRPFEVPIVLTSAQREAASKVVFAGDDISLNVLRAHFEEKAGLNQKPAIERIEFDTRVEPAKPDVLRVTVRLMTANGIIPVEADGKLTVRFRAKPGDEPQAFALGAGLLADYLVKEPGFCEYRLTIRPKGAFDDEASVKITYIGNNGAEVNAGK